MATKEELLQLVEENLPDNVTNEIEPENVREVFGAVLDNMAMQGGSAGLDKGLFSYNTSGFENGGDLNIYPYEDFFSQSWVQGLVATVILRCDRTDQQPGKVVITRGPAGTILFGNGTYLDIPTTFGEALILTILAVNHSGWSPYMIVNSDYYKPE